MTMPFHIMILPAPSKRPQMEAGVALATKHGTRKTTKRRGASRSMHHSTPERQLHEVAAIKRKRKPTTKRRKR
ncbi:MAG: DUF3008 family protein [bacterium]|nr:DUF3008 family protein [bacterium]